MSCEYCHEDRDGYVVPFDKNAHAFWEYPDKLIVRFGKERRECKMKFCPVCEVTLWADTIRPVKYEEAET